MLTRFGKFCRKLRIDNGELLKDMADKLSVTPSYLSAIENGKRVVPVEWVTEIKHLYALNDIEYAEFKKACEESQQTKVTLKNMNREDRDLIVALARDFKDLDDKNKDVLRKIFAKKNDDH